MDVGSFITSQNLFDLLIVLVLFAAFILGFIQGTIRRLLGIASILVSFLFAAQMRDPLGGFLAANWTQFHPQYSHMLGFLVVFVAASIACTIVIQGFYKRTPLMSQTTAVDEILGGILGVLEGMLILGASIVILDSFFRLPGIAPDDDELALLRDVYLAYDPSGFAHLFRETLVPAFFALLGAFFPEEVRKVFTPFG